MQYLDETLENILLKHLKTLNTVSPPATAYLVENCGSQQMALGCSGEGGWRQASGWHGEERHAGAVAVDHVASARRTRRRVVSGSGEIGRQTTALRRGAACHRVSATGSVVVAEHATAMQARWRFESGFELYEMEAVKALVWFWIIDETCVLTFVMSEIQR